MSHCLYPLAYLGCTRRAGERFPKVLTCESGQWCEYHSEYEKPKVEVETIDSVYPLPIKPIVIREVGATRSYMNDVISKDWDWRELKDEV